jgi:heat shock protein HslJ
MRKHLLIAVAVIVALSFAACSSGSGNLTGKDWQLTAITEKVPAFQGVVPAADQARYTITFNTDGTFSGTADCNAISGTYKTSGSSLTITMGASTRVACPEGSFGDLFAHALANAVSYAIANDQLTITLKDGGTLTFVVGAAAASGAPATSPPAQASSTAAPTPQPTASPTARPTAQPTARPTAAPTTRPSSAPTSAPTPAPTPAPTAAPTAAPTPTPGSGLTGKTWQLTAMTEKVPAFQGVVPADQQANYTITFGTDGTFQAKADCNQVAGTYTTTPSGGLSIVLGPTTTVACADGSLSDLYILGLGNASSYAIANNQLTITLADQGTLVFNAGTP